MKYLILILTVLIFSSCGNNDSNLEKLKKQTDSLEKDLEITLKELDEGIMKDEIDYNNTDCKYWVVSKKDDITGKTDTKIKSTIVIGTKQLANNKIKIPKLNAEISVRKDNKEIVIRFDVNGLSPCVDEKDKINILFTDDSKMEIVNQAEYNCDGQIVVWLTAKSKKLLDLKSKKIKKIRATISNQSLDLEFSDNNAVHLNKVLSCISENI